MRRPRNLFLVGPMGAGKSTIGRQLAKELKLDFYDTDLVIEDRTGADVAWIFDVEGEAGFRKREEEVIAELSQEKNLVLATGGGAIISKANRTVLAARGTVVYLSTSFEEQTRRMKLDKKRPLVQKAKEPGSTIDLESMMREREHLYKEIADISVETDSGSVRSVVTTIIHAIDKLDNP